MKRATITLPADLEADLNAYLRAQEVPPSLTSVVQAALRDYLEERRWRARGYRAAKGRLRIPVSGRGSGKRDVSIEHDRYLAE